MDHKPLYVVYGIGANSIARNLPNSNEYNVMFNVSAHRLRNLDLSYMNAITIRDLHALQVLFSMPISTTREIHRITIVSEPLYTHRHDDHEQ